MVRSSINVGRFHSDLLSESFQAHVNVSVSFFPPFLSISFTSILPREDGWAARYGLSDVAQQKYEHLQTQ